jgi:catechol-2,3-dioxygenase
MIRRKFIRITSLSSLFLVSSSILAAISMKLYNDTVKKRGILKLELEASNLEAQFDFYQNILGFKCYLSATKLKIITGTTEIVFKKSSSTPSPFYHIAWAIPGNRLKEAKKWLKRRTSILLDSNGRSEFFFSRINRTGIYFKDPAGNLLEFIALHDLREYNDIDNFTISDISFVNHVGITVKDVIKEIKNIKANLNMEYLSNLNKDFSKIGNDHEHLTLVSENRLWIPERKEPALIFPMKITLPSDVNKIYDIPGHPYQIELLSV